MYMDENCNFEHSGVPEAAAAAEGATAAFHQEYSAAATSAELELQQQQQGLVVGYENNSMNMINTWQQYHQEEQQHHHHQQQQQQDQLLNLFHFSPSSSSSVYVDPLLHLNLPAPPPPSLFGHYAPTRLDGLYLDSVADPSAGLHFEGAGAVLEFGGAMRERSGGRDRSGGATATKHFASERHRRDQMRDTYSMLRSLVPNPTKNDRASVVGDAIEYIKELRRSVKELTMLVERKRRGGEGAAMKRHKPQQAPEEGGGEEAEAEQYSSIRTSWLQRKSKDTEVDVRIVDDEVTVKLVQRKKINLLLLTSKVLDDLRLDLRHVAGGHVGDTYSYLFNTKICQGSSLYASAIANKLIDVLDRQYASVTF